jgi:hypothetical protein
MPYSAYCLFFVPPNKLLDPVLSLIGKWLIQIVFKIFLVFLIIFVLLWSFLFSYGISFIHLHRWIIVKYPAIEEIESKLKSGSFNKVMFQQGYYLRPVCHKYSFIFIPGPSAPPPPYSPEPPGFKREYTQGTICTFEEAYHVLQIILQILIINECSLWSCVPAKYCTSLRRQLSGWIFVKYHYW